jgi:hypothetical protein
VKSREELENSVPDGNVRMFPSSQFFNAINGRLIVAK